MDPFSPQSQQQKDYARSMLAEIHAQFIDVVRRGRGKRLKETPESFFRPDVERGQEYRHGLGGWLRHG